MNFALKVFCLAVLVVHGFAQNENDEGEFGKRQSPIDIQTGQLKSAFMRSLKWNQGYFELPDSMEMMSDGHSIVLSTKQPFAPSISGGPLKHEYRLHSLHFHWGSENNRGSEHTINGVSAGMEIHAVHVQDGYTFEEAKQKVGAICVVGYFVEVYQPMIFEKHRNLDAFKIITEEFEYLQGVNQGHNLTRHFPLKNLLVPFRDEYVTYAGSLTTPDYNEVVIWIVSPYTIKISPKQMERFRALVPELVDDNDNFRPTQPLNGRSVYLARCGYPMSERILDSEYFAQNYYDSLSPYRYNNIYKTIIFNNESYDLESFRGEMGKVSDVTELTDDHIYFFDDYIYPPANANHKNVKLVNYNNMLHPVYHEDNDLTYGVDLMGLIGKNHASINYHPDYIVSSVYGAGNKFYK
ncbi:PREDICTED: carbonic anhydrase 7-like [Nicrophorus vespilloides]|uniref:Carbonic anhydrase 7-like n=1 Tax=Nicrophorus vespilloides TaxID=110193 RepID=A0ABM1MAY8_NICVS|nr:PREDICTED: carbonic anhydrase 7-like [Nicrophorus vespilloides]